VTPDNPPPSSKVRITPDSYQAPASRQSSVAFAKGEGPTFPVPKPQAADSEDVPKRQPARATPWSLVKAALTGAAFALLLAAGTYVVLSLTR